MKMKARSSFETPETHYPVTRRYPKRMESKTPQWKLQDFYFILSSLPFSSFLPLFLLCLRLFFIPPVHLCPFLQFSSCCCYTNLQLSISRRCTIVEAWSTGRCLIWHTAPCRGCDWITFTVVMRRAPGDWSYHDNPHLMTGRQIDVFGYVGGGGGNGGSAGTDRGVTQTSPAGLQGFSTTQHADSQHHFFCTQVSTHTSRSGANTLHEIYPGLRLTRDKLQWNITANWSPELQIQITTNIFITLVSFFSWFDSPRGPRLPHFEVSSSRSAQTHYNR